MGRSAYIVRREGRYLFRTRWPRCLMPDSGSASIRIALGTAAYPVALRRASRIGAWVMRLKAARTPEQAAREVLPQLREMAVLPVKDEDDLVERRALEKMVRVLHLRMGWTSTDPDKLVPGWTGALFPFLLEIEKAEKVLADANTPAFFQERLEANRMAMVRRGELPIVLPRSLATDTTLRSASSVAGDGFANAGPAPVAPAGALRLKLSEALKRFLDHREGQDGDRRAESEIAPIIKFAIALLEDPVMYDMTGDDFLKLKSVIPDIPTKFGFPLQAGADLYYRWSHVRERGWTFERDKKELRYKRTSQTTIQGGWRIALTSFWQFAIKHRFASAPVPDFEIETPKNPGAAERDAFRFQELYDFISSPPFTKCAGRARLWMPGEFFYQGFFYWGELIGLLTGLRPGETAQLRCHDILDLYGRPHIRYAQFSIEQEGEARFSPQQGGKDAKTPAAYRWVPLHWLIIRLGIIERRDAIVADYIAQSVAKAGERAQLSDQQFADIERQAGKQWLFPDWPVYVKSTGEIKWSHALSKAFTYGLTKMDMRRPGLSQYSARHFFKGLIDDVKGLSERSRKIIMGHSTKGNVTDRYGPKMLTEQQSEVVQSLSSFEIWRLSKVLIRAKRKAELGKVVIVDAWRNDRRSGDEKLHAALAKRAEFYR